jgi:hypothetical protein
LYKRLIAILLVLIIVVAAVSIYLYETNKNNSGPKSPQSEGILHQSSPPQFHPNGSYPPVPVVWTITLTKNFSELPVGTTMFLLNTSDPLTGLGYSAYDHFVRDLALVSPAGTNFSDGDKVGFDGQLVISNDINGNPFYGLHGTLTYPNK